MVDHAYKDRRSVSAMLRGTADGRALSWQSFKESHPNISQEELMEQFCDEARYGRIHIKNYRAAISNSKYIAALIAIFIIVF